MARQRDTSGGDYSAFRDEQARRSRERSASGRDLGELPPVGDKNRRAACERDFKVFCETYFAELFPLEWSEDHLAVIATMQLVVLQGGRFPLAMPRGSGKTTLAEVLVLWAILYGHRHFVLVVAANLEKAVEILDRIKTHLETNEVLGEDFPEVCYPIARLERIYNRANGQTLGGIPTRIDWTQRQIVLPTVAGSAASGAIIRVAGILGGGIRGAKHQVGKRAVRPDLVVSDDPQTAASARSKSQNTSRLKVMRRDVLGVAGPGKTISVVMPCTVIVRGDMADQMLDPKQTPGWSGKRFKLLYAMPENMEAWREYNRLRSDTRDESGHSKEATEYYRANRTKMDAGAKPAWPARHLAEELSATQHAMNLFFDDPEGFAAEYNNEPRDETEAATAERLTSEGLAVKLLPLLHRATLPRDASRVTAFVDVQKDVLFWMVVAWNQGFGGAIVDYGTLPEQPEREFKAGGVSRTLKDLFPTSKGLEGPIYSGLLELSAKLIGRAWTRDGIGDQLRITRLLVDANWGKSTKTVYQFARESPHAATITPSHGKGITASKAPFSQYKPNGLKSGQDWRFESGKNGIHVSYDTNAWKSFVLERFATPLGSHGSLGIFAGGVDPWQHKLLFDHLTSEYAITTKGPWREAEEWKLQPGRENHWLDCVVGCAVGASIDGLVFNSAASAGLPGGEAKPKRVSFAERQRLANQKHK